MDDFNIGGRGQAGSRTSYCSDTKEVFPLIQTTYVLFCFYLLLAAGWPKGKVLVLAMAVAAVGGIGVCWSCCCCWLLSWRYSNG